VFNTRHRADGSTRRHLPMPVQACWVECG
jgi:hypothetical protein